MSSSILKVAPTDLSKAGRSSFCTVVFPVSALWALHFTHRESFWRGFSDGNPPRETCWCLQFRAVDVQKVRGHPGLILKGTRRAAQKGWVATSIYLGLVQSPSNWWLGLAVWSSLRMRGSNPQPTNLNHQPDGLPDLLRP